METGTRLEGSMKKFAKSIVGYLGYEITRKKTLVHDSPFATYEISLLTLLTFLDELSIVQVGANDGVINDPIYSFVREFPERTRILLIEPQECLIQHLARNYSFHPKSTIFNGAIGPKGTLKLYSIDQSVWKNLKPSSKGWPAYRGPTGITSTNRQHVSEWLRRNLKIETDIDNAINENLVSSVGLLELIGNLNLSRRVDVLQIDAEGYDDQVIYNSSIGELQPSIINFEVRHLGIEKFDSLKKYLEQQGYIVSCHNTDALAIRVNQVHSKLQGNYHSVKSSSK